MSRCKCMFLAAVVMAVSQHWSGLTAQEQTADNATPSVVLFSRAIAARPDIVHSGIAVVQTPGEQGQGMVARFRLYQDSDGRLRREYLTDDGKTRDVFIRRPDGLYFWRTGTPDQEVRKYPSSTEVDRFGELDLVLRNYDVLPEGEEPVAGRQAYRLKLHCRYGNRPPTRVWVDTQNLMILEEIRYDLAGQPQVERYFEQIEFPDSLNDQLFEPPGDLKVIDMRPRAEAMQAVAPANQNLADQYEQARNSMKGRIWTPTVIPTGFELTSVRSYVQNQTEPSRYILHYGYSDGLTALSIFIQKGGTFATGSSGAGSDRQANDAGGKQTSKPGDAISNEAAGKNIPKVIIYNGVEIYDKSRASKTVLLREEQGVWVTVIGEIDRTDLLRTIVGVEPEVQTEQPAEITPVE